MTDRGFTITLVSSEGCSQLRVEDVKDGRKIASICIDVERTIFRMKNLYFKYVCHASFIKLFVCVDFY